VTRAGFAKVELSSSAIGAQLVGYANREGAAVAIHDPLFARTLVLEHDGERVAMCSVDLCFVNEDVVAATRDRIARVAGIPPERVFVSATHTHSGPGDDDRVCFPGGLDTLIAESVVAACERLRPARVGAGWGMAHGHSLNRRRLEDPVDPAVFVIRIDDLEGAPLGLYYGFACHPVVLGPDNRDVSGDWPATSSDVVETELGPGAVAVFGQGACADVNPLTKGVRERFDHSRAVAVQVEGISYYGSADDRDRDFDVGDRIGGTFAEAERLGRAVAEETLRVHRGIEPEDVTGLWTAQIAISQSGSGGRNGDGPLAGHGRPRAVPGLPLEVMLVGIDGPGVVLVGQPGEVFGETGISLRRELRRAGVRRPFVVGYANGWRAYLAPGHAYPDGGYEVDWARATGLPETLQDDIRDAVLEVARQRSA
jgi:neutral ceramidase